MKNAILAVLIFFLSFPASADEYKSAYDRVMKTQTIRCGYGSNKPWIYQNFETGKMEGLNVRIMEAVAKELGLKLEWPEETGWANLAIALQSKKVDVACSMFWVDPSRAKFVAFTRPLFYTGIYVYARPDDTRFTGKASEINRPDVTISVQDSDMSLDLAKRLFPDSHLIAQPQVSTWAETFLNVTTKKADIVFSDSIGMKNFNDNNEKKLARVPFADPAAVYGNSLAVGLGETELKEMLDATVAYMLDNGKIAEIVADFQREYPDAIIMPKRTY